MPQPDSRRSVNQTSSVSAKAVLQVFNTWAFKREQPDSPELLACSVEAAIAANEPIPFVLYWGKGPRHRIEQPDLICLDFLAKMHARIGEVYMHGARITLLLTDTHARLNGHVESSIARYFSAIREAAAARGLEATTLSEVVARANVELKAVEVPDRELTERLRQSAAKWYRGNSTPLKAALRYHAANMRERLAVEDLYSGAVFVTFNGSKLRDLFPPSMPIFYMYSLRKGIAEKPWFMEVSERDDRLDSTREDVVSGPITGVQ